MSPSLIHVVSSHPGLFVLLMTLTLYAMRRALLPLIVATTLALVLLGLVHLFPGGP